MNVSPYRKAIAAFLTPMSVYLLGVLTSGGDWATGLDVVTAAVVTLATVFLVPNDATSPYLDSSGSL